MRLRFSLENDLLTSCSSNGMSARVSLESHSESATLNPRIVVVDKQNVIVDHVTHHTDV